MASGSVIGRLQGVLNQPHGIPQLDKDRKVEAEQLRIDEANGVAGISAGGSILAPGASIVLLKNASDEICLYERASMELVQAWKRNGVMDFSAQTNVGGVLKTVLNTSHMNITSGVAGLDASAKVAQAQMPNLEIHSQTPQILTGAGAVDITSMITHLITGGAGADALTLPDGVEGQEKIILIKTLSVGGDTSVITPTNFAHGTTITGNAAGSIQNLIFSNGAWHWTGGYGVVIA